MGNANIPQVFNQDMERLAILDKATGIGYRQVHNGIWTARFTLPADDPKNGYCKPFNYVEIYDGYKRVELFRIVRKPFSRGRKGFTDYELEHVVTTLMDDVLFRFHQIGNIGVFTPEVLEFVLGRQTTRRWRLGRCDFRHQFLYKWESSNLLFALFDIPKPFMDDWHFTYDTTSYPWTLNLVRAESEIGCEIRRGKNMQGITKDEDARNLVTRLYPLGYGEGDNQLTIEGVNGGIPYIDADTIPLYGIKASIWTDRRFEDAANMMATGRKMLERLKTPHISYTVESIDLFKRTRQEFDEFAEGKVVRVIDRHDGIDLDTRIMEIDKPDVTKADVSVVIANKDRNVAGSIAALQERTRINETFAQGAETQIPMTFIDNAEPNFPAVFEFFLPSSMVNINEARLRVQLLPFRAFSRAIRGGGGTTQTSTSGGGVSTSTSAGGATTQTTTHQEQQTPTTSTSSEQSPTTSEGGFSSPTTSSTDQLSSTTTSGGGTTATSMPDGTSNMWTAGLVPCEFFMAAAGEPPHLHNGLGHNHPHSHDTTIPGHSHQLNIPGHFHTVNIAAHSHLVTIPGHAHTVTINAHSHSVTIPSHQHNVTIQDHQHSITIPDHTHQIEFGIFTGTRAESVSIRVDGNNVPVVGELDNINIIPFLRRDGGGRIARNTWHRLELVPDRLTRLSASLFLTIFTNSRGGENL